MVLAERVEGDRPELSDELIVGLVTAWTQLYGLISFEVFGQFNNVVEDPAALLTTAARAAAASLGLR